MPCPLCGGLIHPIAGKCKHCKADLASLHAARPPATTPLPALRAPTAPTTTGQVHWHPGRGDGATPPAGRFAVPPAPAAPMLVEREDSQPILPPRPTHRGHAVEPDARGGWRSWPVIVIALAMVAIVVAVVLMVWPAGGHPDGARKRSIGAPPAPERMDTAPEVTAPAPHAQATPPDRDPWASPASPPSRAAPPAQARINPDDNTPDADSDPDPDNQPDPFADPGSPSRGKPQLGLNHGASMALVMAVHMCRKARQCDPSGDLPIAISAVCAALRNQPTKLPPHCPAATRCLAHIDALSCAGTTFDPQQTGALLQQFQDCNDATQC